MRRRSHLPLLLLGLDRLSVAFFLLFLKGLTLNAGRVMQTAIESSPRRAGSEIERKEAGGYTSGSGR